MIGSVETTNILQNATEGEKVVDAGIIILYSPKKLTPEGVIETSSSENADYIDGEFLQTDSEDSCDNSVGFQVWFESGLVFIDTDDNLINSVIEAIEQSLDIEGQIHERFNPYTEQVWQFIDEADEHKEIDVVAPTGSIIEIADEDLSRVRNEYPVDHAVLGFSVGGQSVDVTFSSDNLSINSSNDFVRAQILNNFDDSFI